VVDKIPFFLDFLLQLDTLVYTFYVIDLTCTQFQLVETFGLCHIFWNLTVAQVGEFCAMN